MVSAHKSPQQKNLVLEYLMKTGTKRKSGNFLGQRREQGFSADGGWVK
jgi:hypothetical protein